MTATTIDPTAPVGAVTPDAPKASRSLTAADRCDACVVARAYVEVGIVGENLFDDNFKPITVSLLFCSHHYTEHEPKIATRNTVRFINDQRPEQLYDVEANRKSANPNGNGFA